MRELPSTGETTLSRSPGGFEPVYHLFTTAITLPQSVTHVDYTPKQHTKKRGALGNTKNTKIKRGRTGTRVAKVCETEPKESIQNERSPIKC